MEIERPVETEKPVETERPAETGERDSVDELLEGSFDTGALMDISQDYKSGSGSENEGLGSEGIFEMDTIVPVSPIYRRSAKGVVGSGVNDGFYNSSEDSSEDDEGEKKDGAEANVDEEADIGAGAAVASEGVEVSKAAAAVAAEVSPVLEKTDDLTIRDETSAPMEQMVTVGAILDRDGYGGGPGSATADGGAVVGQGVGPPVPDLQALYGVVPELLVASNMDLFNHLLVSLGLVC